jgi:hypothetical protein
MKYLRQKEAAHYLSSSIIRFCTIIKEKTYKFTAVGIVSVVPGYKYPKKNTLRLIYIYICSILTVDETKKIKLIWQLKKLQLILYTTQ